jgi:hypothetical protein
LNNKPSILERWGISEAELTTIIDTNPSLRGMMIGYLAEFKLQRLLSEAVPQSKSIKPDDHDRNSGSKNDLVLEVNQRKFTFEVKSLQSNSIKQLADGTLVGTVQVDASDRRTVTLSDGTALETTCLLAGEFDILAINLYAFTNQWTFAFILNRDLPRSSHKKYTEFQQSQLLATIIKITYPVQQPYTENPLELLDILLRKM